MKFEEYIKESEISQQRTPQEYVDWFEQKLAITKKLREELKAQNLLHRGVAKIFYEELFPLYRLLQNKLKKWENIKFKPIIGNQNYDVEVSTCRENIPSYIEITVTNFDEVELASMKYLLNHGVGRIDKIAHCCEEINQKVKDRIIDRINDKITKKPPQNTALLVHFDDYMAFRYDEDKSKIKMNSFLAFTIPWQNRFVALYVVGASGSFYERHRIGKNLDI